MCTNLDVCDCHKRICKIRTENAVLLWSVKRGIVVLPNGVCGARMGGKQGARMCVFEMHHFTVGTEEIGVNPAAVLHALSLAILCIFMVEVSVWVYVCAHVCEYAFSLLFQIIMKIIAFGMPFFTHKFEVFDATVVLLSWILDVASQ